SVRIAHLEVSASGDRKILLPIDLIGHRGSVDPGAEVVSPELLARLRIEGIEPAITFTHEDNASSRRQGAPNQRLGRFVLPGYLATLPVQRDERTVLNSAGCNVRERTAEANEARNAPRRLRSEVHQLVHRQDIEIVCLR